MSLFADELKLIKKLHALGASYVEIGEIKVHFALPEACSHQPEALLHTPQLPAETVEWLNSVPVTKKSDAEIDEDLLFHSV